MPVSPFSTEELEAIFGALAITDSFQFRDFVILHTLWDTGLRVGEMIALTLDDVDLEFRDPGGSCQVGKMAGYWVWKTDTEVHVSLSFVVPSRAVCEGDRIFSSRSMVGRFQSDAISIVSARGFPQ